MFGLTFREKIVDIIIDTYVENTSVYSELLMNKLDEFDGIPTADELMLICESAINQFEALMFKTVSEIALSLNSSISARFMLACKSPQLCGVSENSEDILCSTPVLCYALLYWAYYNKKYSLSNNNNFNDAYKIVEETNEILSSVQEDFSRQVSLNITNKHKRDDLR